jgi:LysM repeat protein
MGMWSPARVVAPLALIAAAVGVVVVVQASRPRSSSDAGTNTRAPAATHRHRGAKGRRGLYVVKPGDNLTAIAEKTGVPLEQIQRLNPSLDAQTLSVGQRLKLTR